MASQGFDSEQSNDTSEPVSDPSASACCGQGNCESHGGAGSQVDAQLDSHGQVDSQEQDTVETEIVSVEDTLRTELTEMNDRWMRSQAEVENVRRRSRRDMADQIKFASKGVIEDLLGVLENLNRAMEATAVGDGNQGQSAGLATGVKMVCNQFQSVLEKHGCLRMDCNGQVFDPNIHEAIQMVPHDSVSGTIVQEVRAGFKLHDRVVRPAQVIVSSGPTQA